MLPIDGKPLLEHQINYLKKYGITEIIFAVGHLKSKIISYFGNGSRYGIYAKYSLDEFYGTGGALKGCKDLLEDTFILMNGDTIFNLNIESLLKEHKKLNNEITRVCDINFIPVGIYAINKKLLYKIPDGVCSLENDILNESTPVYIYEDDWYDIGTPKEYEKYK